ncbi:MULTISPECIES: restriction endonuclease subunit S [Vibrio]|uniref:restriction endonuclease subunit S n=1 Tax=Vibrio TaxID=662 RepID=UPI001CDC7217|nr:MULTISPECIES: restriction endonuclease subunit S [Vibrio]MCA2456594.1 restriction endonuclease subunit S [Vibrio alginolyticus]MCA2462540.1 restriction endonuclease subunit S [Vibrio alginolyticus]MDW2268924.1 restriction endonuclease subunit S [Vibrio sp. 1394]MDW2295494.1 restriction endonuclease subunit S [Vibrio sp. 1404]
MKTMKIPSGWKLCKQSDVSAFYNGRAYKLSEWETEGTPVIRLQNLTGTGNEYYYSNLKLPEHQYADNGDLLYMWSATFGPKIWQGEKAIYHYHIWKVVCKDDLLDQSFMYYNLDFITESMKSKTNGSTMLHFTKKGMEEHEILLPPLAEQQKIAEVLSTVDKKIDLIDQKIAETEKLKTGLMQKLFSEGVGVQDENGNWQPHAAFQDSPFGKIPRAWKYAPVKSLVSIKSPKYDPKIKTESLPCIELEHLSQGSGEILGTVNSLELASTKNCFAKGDVLFGKLRPYLKKFAKPNFNGVCSSEIWVMKTTDNKVLHNDFWFYFIQSDRFINEANKSCGTKMPRADWKVVSELILPIPSFCEQLGIAKILECVDAKLGLLKQQKAETQQLKKGLMQKLLTGEWRVPVEETEAA